MVLRTHEMSSQLLAVQIYYWMRQCKSELDISNRLLTQMRVANLIRTNSSRFYQSNYHREMREQEVRVPLVLTVLVDDGDHV